MISYTQRVLKAVLVAIFAIASFCPQVSAAAPDINEKVTIAVKNVSMQQFFAEIEKHSNYTFFYSNTVLNGAPNVSVSVKEMPIEQLLHKAFNGTNLTFEVIGNKIAIKVVRSVAKTEGGGISTPASKPTPKPGVAEAKSSTTDISKPHVVMGTVFDENGKPMAGVGVIIVTTLQGVVTDINGQYQIKATPVQDLQFSFLGYKTQTIQVGSRTKIDVAMITEAQSIESVIVTALGIQREEKSLGYAASKVDGDMLASATNSTNWLSGLTGQVAGLNIQQSNTGAGTTRVTLRGESSVDFSNNTALFVVDGVPMHNHSTQSDAGDEGSLSVIDYGDGTGDVNPEDIESVTILKGPAATALYGSAAANGAIIITTKSANNLASKISVTYSTNLTFESVNTSPDLQYEYGQGYRSDFYYYLRDSDSKRGSGFNPEPTYSTQTAMVAYGPKMDGTPYYQYYDASKGIGGSFDAFGDFRRKATPFISYGDWFKDFFETGYSWTNTVAVSGRINKRNSIRVSVRDTHSHSITPNSPSNMQHISLRTQNEIAKWFTSEVSLNYRHDKRDNIPVASGYSAGAGIMYSLWCYAPNIDMDWVKNYWLEGKEGTNQDTTLSGGKNNAYFVANESINTQNRNRLYGNVKLNFNIYKGLTLMVRGGLDMQHEFRTQRLAKSTQSDPDGYYREQLVNSMQYSGEFLFRYHHKFKHNINLTANFGGSIRDRQYERHAQKADNLKEPGIYTLANSETLVKTDNYMERHHTSSLYGLVQLSWRNALFIDVTGRNDWSSTLPAANRSYFYPSVSGSAVLNELLDFGSRNGLVNLLKVRASWAQVGHDTKPYRIEEYFKSTTFPGNVTTQTSKVNGTLYPEKVSSWEVGVDLRMFSNRFNLDMAYYRSKTTNALASMPVSLSTGMGSVFTNAGSILNHGFEIQATGTIIRTKDIRWNITANWSINRNKILQLGEGIDYWEIASRGSYAYMYAYEGNSLTSMYGRKYKRAPEGSYVIDASGKVCDVSGQIVHDNLGKPILDNEISYIGDCSPKWRGGFGTSFSWKGIKASIKFDGQYGGHVWSETSWVMNSRGKGIATLEGREGGFVPKGVVELNDGNYEICNYVHSATTIQAYYQSLYARECCEANFVETSFLKLRQVRLEYTFPKKLLAKAKVIQGLTVAVFGNNLYCWSNFPAFDPEAVSMRGAALSPGFDLLQMPGRAVYGGNISVTF